MSDDTQRGRNLYNSGQQPTHGDSLETRHAYEWAKAMDNKGPSAVSLGSSQGIGGGGSGGVSGVDPIGAAITGMLIAVVAITWGIAWAVNAIHPTDLLWGLLFLCAAVFVVWRWKKVGRIVAGGFLALAVLAGGFFGYAYFVHLPALRAEAMAKFEPEAARHPEWNGLTYQVSSKQYLWDAPEQPTSTWNFIMPNSCVRSVRSNGTWTELDLDTPDGRKRFFAHLDPRQRTAKDACTPKPNDKPVGRD